ncbi:hypothetical protein [Phaeobacter sp. J2-8]|uniref:hypothetical protein n=1 Tax=Phaeobacter sp. J2-8 TaxID=2931394 RepID=UPI001FD51F2C|nr:hypothetical protein [Phaeobacter sp. J2-8]MCJ7871190.1 hypothetical protein [Phaeobacter sp. J2-8]
MTSIGVFLFGVVLVVSLLAPLIAPYDPYEQSILSRLENASGAHWMGTDIFGRDTLTRVMYGARLSIVIALTATAIAFLIGTALG